jgi:hypothetical protein
MAGYVIRPFFLLYNLTIAFVSVKIHDTKETFMITLTPIKGQKRHWKFTVENNKNQVIELDLELMQYSLTNRFDIVKDLFEEFNELVPSFSNWYYTLIKKYVDSGYNSELIKDATQDFIKYSKKFIKAKEIDFPSFVNRTKKSTTSILFEEVDIESIALASTCLKLYSLFNYDVTLKVPNNINKYIYNKFVSECVDTGTTDKIFQLIRSRTYRSSATRSRDFCYVGLQLFYD